MDHGFSYFVARFFLFLQSALDFLLDLAFGYFTKEGWRKERERLKQYYEASAQLVSIIQPWTDIRTIQRHIVLTTLSGEDLVFF